MPARAGRKRQQKGDNKREKRVSSGASFEEPRRKGEVQRTVSNSSPGSSLCPVQDQTGKNASAVNRSNAWRTRFKSPLTSLLSFQKLKMLKLCTSPISQIPCSNALPSCWFDKARRVGYRAGRAILEATVRMAVKRMAEVERV